MKFGKKWRRKNKQTNEESVSVLVFITDIPVSTFLFPGNDQIINTVVELKACDRLKATLSPSAGHSLLINNCPVFFITLSQRVEVKKSVVIMY